MTEHPASAQLYGNPPPGGSSAVIEAADGIKLRFAHWPAKGEARGAILLAQGRTEYIEKAYEWIEKFRARGLHVAAFDFRGQGMSERLLPNRRRGYVKDFARNFSSIMMLPIQLFAASSETACRSWFADIRWVASQPRGFFPAAKRD